MKSKVKTNIIDWRSSLFSRIIALPFVLWVLSSCDGKQYLPHSKLLSIVELVYTHNSMANNQKQMPSQIRAHTHTHTQPTPIHNAHGNIVVFIHAAFSDAEKWRHARKRRISYTSNETKCAFCNTKKKYIKCWKNPIKHRHSTPKMLSNEKWL